ncbi:olfactory receptor 1M1-like [Polypterus senegalus]
MSNISALASEFVLHCAIDSQQKSYTIPALIFVYLVTIFGNVLVILVIKMNHQLHTPMFYCIGTLAIIDLANSTNLIPKMLAVLLDSSKIASGPCILQMFLVLHLEAVESLLFTLMACDRYVAVVYPLRYPSLITNKIVWVGVFISNVVVTLALVPYLVFVHELPFCRTRVLPYCFCDYATMVNIACTEEPKYLIVLTTTSTMLGMCPLILILLSYLRIAYAALSISSVDGKKKVFSTLGTHLLVVGLFYLPLLISYMLPGIGIKLSTEAYNTMVIVSNVVPPMMNPLIYSFRNKEIKGSIQRLFKWKVTPETGQR